MSKKLLFEMTGKFSKTHRGAELYQSKRRLTHLYGKSMPDLSGNGAGKGLDGRKKSDAHFEIVLRQAYQQFAIEGYKVDALELIAEKPYSYEEFLKLPQKLAYFENLIKTSI